MTSSRTAVEPKLNRSYNHRLTGVISASWTSRIVLSFIMPRLTVWGSKRWWPSSVSSMPDHKWRTEGFIKLKIGRKEAPWHGWSVTPFRRKVKGQGNKVTSQSSFSFATRPTADGATWPISLQSVKYQFKLCSLPAPCGAVLQADMCSPVSATSGRTHLRFAVHCDLVVPRTRLSGPLWASRFRRLGSSDLEQSAAWSSRQVSVCCQFLQPTQDWTVHQGMTWHDKRGGGEN